MRLQTNAIHTGVDKDNSYNSVIPPIYQTSTFRFDDVGKIKGMIIHEPRSNSKSS